MNPRIAEMRQKCSIFKWRMSPRTGPEVARRSPRIRACSFYQFSGADRNFHRVAPVKMFCKIRDPESTKGYSEPAGHISGERKSAPPLAFIKQIHDARRGQDIRPAWASQIFDERNLHNAKVPVPHCVGYRGGPGLRHKQEPSVRLGQPPHP